MTNIQTLLRLRHEREVSIHKAHTYHRGVRDAMAHGEKPLARELGRYAAHHRKVARYYTERCDWLDSMCK